MKTMLRKMTTIVGLVLVGTVIDPTNPTAIGPPGGPTQIVEHVLLSRDGNR
jgi:hypothetical protein